MRKQRVAVDVGGTFTDVCVFDTDVASTTVAKVPSTPEDPVRAVLDGLRAAEVDLSEVALFSHGTTVATNALITRKFPPAAMVTTRGFRDVLEIRNGTKDDLWDAYKDVGSPYIRRRDRYEVTERINYSGDVVTPLDEDEARQVARVLRRKGVHTVAIGFINSYANAAHEQRMKDAHYALKRAFGGRVRAVGNSYTGVGVNDCIRAARDVARQLNDEGIMNDKTGLEQFVAPPKWVRMGTIVQLGQRRPAKAEEENTR